MSCFSLDYLELTAWNRGMHLQRLFDRQEVIRSARHQQTSRLKSRENIGIIALRTTVHIMRCQRMIPTQEVIGIPTLTIHLPHLRSDRLTIRDGCVVEKASADQREKVRLSCHLQSLQRLKP